MSKYKYSLHPRIKSIVEWQLEHYPGDKREMQSRKNDLIPSAAASYAPSTGHSSETHRSTEDVAEGIITDRYIAQLEKSCRAIDHVLHDTDGIDRRIVELVYWRREYTVDGAAFKLHLARSTAYNRINALLGAIALEMGCVII